MTIKTIRGRRITGELTRFGWIWKREGGSVWFPTISAAFYSEKDKT